MMEREEIIRMIETKESAVKTALESIEELSSLLVAVDGIADIAAADQLKAAVTEGVIVQGGKKKDMSELLELAGKKQNDYESLLMEDILFWRYRLERALAFNRAWDGSLTSIEKAVLWQRHGERRLIKEIEFDGRRLSDWEYRRTRDEGIKRLQERMSHEGFSGEESRV